MIDHTNCEFCQLVSSSRLIGLEHLADTPHEAYFRGISVALEFWPILTTLELAIRNSFSDRLIDKYGLGVFNTGHNVFSISQINQIERCKAMLTKRGKAEATFNDLVSNLNFGFWTQLVTKQYESRLWAPMLKSCFNTSVARD